MSDEPQGQTTANLPAVQESRATKAPIVAGHRPLAIVPQSFDEAYRIANAITASGMAPKDYNTAERAMVAILHGLEVGLAPMQALQSIAVINGRPTLWGDGALGLVRASGLLEWIREEIKGEGDARVAVCTLKRKGEPEPIVRTFSVDDAKRAGLWGKAGPWTTYPTRMMPMRARAWGLRDGFADVLKGLQIREEVEDYQDVTPQKAPSPSVAPSPTPAIAAPVAEPVAPKVVEAIDEPLEIPDDDEPATAKQTAAPGPSAPKPAAPKPKPAAAAPPTGAHDPTTPAGILAIVEQRCAGFDGTVDEFADFWNASISSIVECLPMHERQDAIIIYERHEARLKAK